MHGATPPETRTVVESELVIHACTGECGDGGESIGVVTILAYSRRVVRMPNP